MALAVAVVAAVVLNSVLLGTFVWPELFAPAPHTICWVFLSLAWCVSAGYGVWVDRRSPETPRENLETLFEQALDEYLKGNWFEAERKLDLLLCHDDRDLEARLLLATLLRHTNRFDDATRQLNQLARLEGAHRWALEIHREGELLIEARKDNITSENPQHGDS